MDELKFYSYSRDEVIDYATFPLQATAALIVFAWIIGLLRGRFDGAILITAYLIVFLIIMLFFIVPQWSSVAISEQGISARLFGHIWRKLIWQHIQSIQRIDFVQSGDTIPCRSLIVIRSDSRFPQKLYVKSRIDGFEEVLRLLDQAAKTHAIALHRDRRRPGSGSYADYFAMGAKVESLI